MIKGVLYRIQWGSIYHYVLVHPDHPDSVIALSRAGRGSDLKPYSDGSPKPVASIEKLGWGVIDPRLVPVEAVDHSPKEIKEVEDLIQASSEGWQ